jgi:hypothetical protein
MIPWAGTCFVAIEMNFQVGTIVAGVINHSWIFLRMPVEGKLQGIALYNRLSSQYSEQ